MEKKLSGPSEWEMLRGSLSRGVTSEGQRLKAAFAATFLLGLLAHGFGFANLFLNHDSLHEFYWTVSTPWKFALGRFFAPVLRYFMGEIVVLPWLTTLTGLALIALSVHFLSKIFRLDRIWQILLLSGICVTNIVVTALIATYLHDFAGDMLALLLCVIALWAWSKMDKKFHLGYTLVGAACIGLSFCLYQAYLAVTATAICIFMIQGLLRGKNVKETILHGLRGLLMAILAFVGYMGLVFCVQRFLGLSVSTGYVGNDVTMMGTNLPHLWDLSLQGYRDVLQVLFSINAATCRSLHSLTDRLIVAGNMILLVMGLIRIGLLAKERKLSIQALLLIAALLVMMPIAMSCVNIISSAFHTLLTYSYYLFYLWILVVLSEKREPQPRLHRTLCPLTAGLLIAGVIISNMQVSNCAYTKKSLESQAALSTMTRVAARLEAQPGYIPGQTPVSIIGDVSAQQAPLKIPFLEKVIGMDYVSPVTYSDVKEDYFSIILQCPIQLVDGELRHQLAQTEAYQQMPCFPADGSIQYIQDVLVVKLSQ